MSYACRFVLFLNSGKNVLKLRSCLNERFFHRAFSSLGTSEHVLNPKETVDIPNITLHQCLMDAMEKFADKTYMVDGEDDSSYTFSEGRDRSLRFASALARLGVAKGDMVAIVAPNCTEYFIAVLGTIVLGATVTTVSPNFTSSEIASQLNDSESSVVICHEDRFTEVNEVLKGVKSFRHLIMIGERRNGAFSFSEMLKDDGKGIPSHIEIDPSQDIAVLPYSSGTTGLPKGVMLTHANVVSNAYQGAHPNVLPLSGERDEVLISVLPTYHIYGFFFSFCISCMFGAKNIILKKYDTASYVNLIDKYKATSLQTVPPILSALCNDKIVTPAKLSSVRSIICGAAPVGPALYQKFFDKFGSSIKLVEAYGLTETSPSCNFSKEDKFISGSCGPPVPSTYLKVLHLETGEKLCSGKIGELCYKGPQVMKGYWKNPEATKKTLVDGWLHTGDIGKVDESGNVYIVDRLKELIKVKGLQVAPAELEDLLRTHPAVDDVAVIGIPDDRAGELPKAFVVPSKEHSASEEELISFVEAKVAPYKRLKGGLVMVNEIPKSVSGKILRRILRERF